MHFSRISVPFVLFSLGRATRHHARQEVPANAAVPIPNTYIIEYTPEQANARAGSDAEDDVVVLKTFDSKVFRGASVQTEKLNIDQILALSYVSRVWPNELIKLDPVDLEGFSDDAAAVKYTSHNSTGVNKLHDAGIFGDGVIIGVVDTGTNYRHPALGGCFGPGCKVAKGYDFVGNGNGGTHIPDDDPDDQQGHGTHVSGIIAGKTDTWSGVAPGATLYSYKVFDQAAGTDTATLIAAFLRAYEDGVDIITSSIGGASGFSTNAWAVVASRLVEEGVFVVISAGNSGAAGPFFGSSGSSGENVVAVASVETDVFPASPFEASFSLGGKTDTTKIGYLPATSYFPPTIANWPIVAFNLDVTAPADGCTPYPAGTPRLDGAVALVRRGTCAFTIKQQNLYALGAKYVLIYNTPVGALVTPSTTETRSLIAMITAKSGEAIINTIKAGGNVTANFSINPELVVGLEYPAGGRPNIFTSWGALYDLQIKPDIAAPGGQIFSTDLGTSFSLKSGTSMACPYVAGVAALYIGVHGGRKVHGKAFGKSLGRRIISSGKALPWSDGTATNYGYSASVAQVGNGLIDAFKIVNYATTLAFEKIALNDTAFHSRYHDISVTNGGAVDVTYTLSADYSAGVESAGWFPQPGSPGDFRLKSFTELTPKKLEADIVFPRAFTLKAGESKTVSVTFRNPDVQGWNASALPIYSGKVIVSGTNGDQLSVPYLGLGANLKQVINPIFRPYYPMSKSGVLQSDIRDKASYSFNLTLASQDFPKVYSKLIWGCTELRWDIFEANWPERKWVYPPVIGANGYVGSATAWAGSGQFSTFNPNIYSPDETFDFPLTEVYRNAQTTAALSEYWWFGKLANGTQIANGNYTMRFAALKPFGNPLSADNWSVFKTPQITVSGKY